MTSDFFERNDWSEPGRVDWHVLGLFHQSDTLHERLVELRRELSSRDMYQVLGQDQLHLTLARIGDTTSVDVATLDAVVSTVSAAWNDVSVPELVLREPWSWHGSVCVAVEPSDAIREMQALLAEQLHDRLSIDRRAFVPHVTLAYPRGRSADRLMRHQLKHVDFQPLAVTLDRLSLVRQWAQPPGFAWEIVRDLWAPSDLVAADGGQQR